MRVFLKVHDSMLERRGGERCDNDKRWGRRCFYKRARESTRVAHRGKERV